MPPTEEGDGRESNGGIVAEGRYQSGGLTDTSGRPEGSSPIVTPVSEGPAPGIGFGAVGKPLDGPTGL